MGRGASGRADVARLAGKFQRGDLQPILLVVLAVASAVALIGALAWWLDLAPPRSLAMAAGRPGSGYHAIAERYRAILAEDRIELAILESAGSVENARLLAEGLADVALLQGGVAVPDGAEVEALAAVFLEPLLIFHRGETERAVDPVAWAELRVAAGEPGSGTRAAVLAAARALALPLTPEMLLPIGGTDAVQALLERRVDVAVFVAPVTAPYLEPLFQSDEVRIAPIRDAEALARRLPYVRMVDIPPAALDYARRIPDERVPLVAMVAALVARDDLHPALVNRLVRAAERIHAGTDLVNVAPIFPSLQGLGLPVNVQAAAALENGPDAFERLLPYWMSAQVSRFALLLVPIVVLLLPLFRLLPGVYAWRMHSRIYRRYQELKTIEREAESGVAAARLDQLLARLERIDAEARSVRVPPRYREYAYTLRMHIDLVRRKLAEQAADS
jgi:TRAP-type uncharacterized transport system substrate-binding protein